MIRAKVAIFAVTAACALPAIADIPPPPPARTEPLIVGWIDTAKPFCYAREYDAAHMAKHPKQKVTSLALTYVPEKVSFGEPEPQKLWDQYADFPAFSGIIAVKFKGDDRVALGPAYCKTGSSKMLECGVEGDGGSFNVLLQDDGRAKLVNADSFTVMFPPPPGAEEETEFYVQVDPKDDHAAFVLSEATGGLCDADWPQQVED